MIAETLLSRNANPLEATFGLSKFNLDCLALEVVTDVTRGLRRVIDQDIFELSPLSALYAVNASFVKTLNFRNIQIIAESEIVRDIEEAQRGLSLLVPQ